MNEWQPIDTASKDGSFVLLAGGMYYCEDANDIYGTCVGRYVRKDYKDDGNPMGVWLIASREGGWADVLYKNPTHWMPLPDSPNDAIKQIL